MGGNRTGPKRGFKFAFESLWDDKTYASNLEWVAKDLRASIWKQMSEVGVTSIPNNTFSYYDHVPKTIAMVGAMPSCYKWSNEDIHHNVYFSMVLKNMSKPTTGMTKWSGSQGDIYISTRVRQAKQP